MSEQKRHIWAFGFPIEEGLLRAIMEGPPYGIGSRPPIDADFDWIPHQYGEWNRDPPPGEE